MNISRLSINRPVFMTCVLVAIIVMGIYNFTKLPIDLFPDINFPVITVTIPYPGAGPKEIETLIAKPVEEQLATISGVKHLRSLNREGVSLIVTEFTLETNIDRAEQEVRDKLATARKSLPTDILEPTLRRLDPSDIPVMILALESKLPPAKLYDIATETIKPQLEQVPLVGLVDVFGGRQREILVELDRNKLRDANLSVSAVTDRLALSGMNIPAGSTAESEGQKDVVFRTVGEFSQITDIKDTVVSFWGNDISTKISDLGEVKEGLAESKNYAIVNGNSTLLLYVYKQSGVNTLAVADSLKKKIVAMNAAAKAMPEDARTTINIEIDRSRDIRLNVEDVYESILIGIALTVIVVFFFLGSFRSTLITGVSIPVSLIGTFTLMNWVGFNINVMSLLAFSLSVGLLIDDAIVVRENIFRHMEMGKDPKTAAREGTEEVMLAVIGVTATILAVFFPMGFLSGVVGRFFKSFGFTVCFIMMLSLFDALSNAPMLSAYLSGDIHNHKPNFLEKIFGWPLRAFGKLQDGLDNIYGRLLKVFTSRPWYAIGVTVVITLSCFYFLSRIPKTFLPAQDNGQFAVSLEADPSTSLDSMREQSLAVDKVIRDNKNVVSSVMVVGNAQGEKNKTEFTVILTPFGKRDETTSQVKEEVRVALKQFDKLNPKVKDVDIIGGGIRPFTLNIMGQDMKDLEEVSAQIYAKLEKHPSLVDVDQSLRPGKAEFQIELDRQKAADLGLLSSAVGRELRAQLEGMTPNVFRENGLEYDIRVRLKEDQRNLNKNFNEVYVPNINGRLIKLSSVAKGEFTSGLASIDREARGRFVQISADIAPDSPGMGQVIKDIDTYFKNDVKLKEGMSYRYIGQAENFQELVTSMLSAALLGLIFIYLILSSLYESFLTPILIMAVIPLAACGAFFALWITKSQFDLFSMIGCIMLMALAVKNSIIYVDYMRQMTEKGMDLKDAILEAGRTRLRPILMTSFALVAGMVPVAIGLNEVSNQRRGLGIAVIGGVLSSTFLTLILIPSAYVLLQRFTDRAKRMVVRDKA